MAHRIHRCHQPPRGAQAQARGLHLAVPALHGTARGLAERSVLTLQATAPPVALSLLLPHGTSLQPFSLSPRRLNLPPCSRTDSNISDTGSLAAEAPSQQTLEARRVEASRGAALRLPWLALAAGVSAQPHAACCWIAPCSRMLRLLAQCSAARRGGAAAGGAVDRRGTRGRLRAAQPRLGQARLQHCPCICAAAWQGGALCYGGHCSCQALQL